MNTQTALANSYDFSAIDLASLQETTKWKYRRELEQMLLAGVNPDDYEALQAYAGGLKSSRKQFLKAALRLVTLGYEQSVKAQATPQNVLAAQAALMRLEAMRGAIIVPQHEGTKAHTLLTGKEVKKLTSLCSHETIEGKRDWIVLGLLLGAGLRREELAELKFSAIKHQGERTVLEVKGKGAKDRVIPISNTLANHLKEWQHITGDGFVARAMFRKRKDTLTNSMSAVAIFQLVNKYGKLIGKELAPHDLRRTYAQLGYDAGVPITQISVLLGHSNIKTTQEYLNLDLDLETTASDFIPLSGD
jgi:integrase